MRRSLIGLCCAAALLVAGSAGSGSASPSKPTLILVNPTPLVVRGAHFLSSERVTLTAALKKPLHRTLTARKTGAFRVAFGVSPSRCTNYEVRAVGSKGSRATLQVPVECPIPPDQDRFPSDPPGGKTHRP
jgi:hypothetical protein